MRSHLLLALTLSALLAGCGAPQVSDIGGGTTSPGDDDDVDPTPTPAGQFISVDSAGSDIDLKDAKTIPFVVRGGAGFTGSVTVTLSGLPAGVTAATTTKTVNVTAADTDFTDVFDITSDNNSAAPGSYQYHLAASAGTLTAAKDANLDVNPFMTIQTETSDPGNDGSFTFWDKDADFQADGTVVHLGNATMITFSWVKAWDDTQIDRRIHANNGSGTIDGANSNSALSIIAGMPCDLNGVFQHSGQCTVTPMQSSEDGKGNLTVFRRTLRPSNPAAVTVVTYYDHLNGSPGGAATDFPGKITIMP